MALTPEEVRNKQFTTVRFKEGYDLDEVDSFLDEIEVEISRLSIENDDLRATSKGELPASISNELSQLQTDNADLKVEVERLRAALSDAETRNRDLVDTVSDSGDSSAVEGLNDSLAAAQSKLAAANAEKAELESKLADLAAANEALTITNQTLQVSATRAPAAVEVAAPSTDSSVAAVRMLELAQRTADEHLASARQEAEKLVSEATSEAERAVTEAKNHVASITREFESQRVGLERRVEELRAYEREYRSRLRSYLEGQLRELENKNINGDRQIMGD